MGYKLPHDISSDSPPRPHSWHRSGPAPHRLGRDRDRRHPADFRRLRLGGTARRPAAGEPPVGNPRRSRRRARRFQAGGSRGRTDFCQQGRGRHVEAWTSARGCDAGARDVRDFGRRTRPEPGEEDRGRRWPRRQEPDSGDAEDPAAEGRSEIPRRRRRAGDRHYARASSPERGAAAEDGRDMIGKLKGLIDSYGEDYVILDVGGVGYQVHCSGRTLQALPAPGEAAVLSIETYVREDQIKLFGFRSDIEREWFRLLQTVQGVGAKVALAVLGTLPPSDLANAIALRDKATVARTPGVGPKVAERIVTELKDKAPAFANVDPALVHLSGAIDDSRAPRPVTDAISALVNLGYGQPQAAAAIACAPRSAGGGAGAGAA